MSNKVTHFEIAGKGSAKLREFYGKLFDWQIKVEAMPGGEYAMVKTGEGEIGGGITDPMNDANNYVLIYIGVDDIHGALAKAEKLGGKIISPPHTIPGVVTFALFQDPSGNILGLTDNKIPE
jgi:predicted enzyme related to lactoylglutathione lyase